MLGEPSADDTDRPLARPEFWSDHGEEFHHVMTCGGSEDDPHAVPMEFVPDAATPYAVCPICNNRAFLHNARSTSTETGQGGDRGC